ncbi:MAG: glycosyltransferase family 4 protein [Patescibacteria group bacterium]|nr:glycosyltransferase family 4 protein [Patescibacteria group bacterium]
MINKNILIITPTFYPAFGGIEEQCRLLAEEFIKRGCNVDVLTEQIAPNLPLKEKVDGVNVNRLRRSNRKQRFYLFFISLGIIVYLLQNRNKYELCIIRTIKIHSFTVAFMKFFKLFNAKTFVTIDSGGDKDDIVLLKKWPFYKLIIFFLNTHDCLNSICDDNYNHYKNFSFNQNRLSKIYNGINTLKYQKSNYPKNINSFFFIGRLIKDKGIQELLKAFQILIKKYPNKKLYIGGDGEEKEYVLNFIKNNKLKNNVYYLGFIDKDLKETFFQRGDCLVLPSYTEGFPISILEALLYKRLIICSDVSDVKKFYKNSIIYCHKKDVKNLYQKMLYAIENYSSSRLNYDPVIKKIDIKNTVNQILERLEI